MLLPLNQSTLYVLGIFIWYQIKIGEIKMKYKLSFFIFSIISNVLHSTLPSIAFSWITQILSRCIYVCYTNYRE